HVFIKSDEIVGPAAQAEHDRLHLRIDFGGQCEIRLNGFTDRNRLARGDSAIIAGKQHGPLGERYEQRVMHAQLDRYIVAVEPDSVDVVRKLAQDLIVYRGGKGRRLEIGRQVDGEHVGRFVGGTPRLRIG